MNVITNKKISLFIPSLQGAGAEKVVVNLANSFISKGYDVDLIVIQKTGKYLNYVNSKINIINLNCSRVLFSLFSLISYIREKKPDVFLSSLSHCNVMSIIANTFVKKKSKVIVIEHNDLRNKKKKFFDFKTKILNILMLITYSRAYKVIAVSKGVFEYILKRTLLESSKIEIIHNPIFDETIINKSKEKPDHPWIIDSKLPIILGVGRLNEQKNFELLIKAFASVKKKIDAKLIILGEGKLRNDLNNIGKKLEVDKDISLPGFVENPYSYMASSSVLVVSSNYEGFGNVIVEAMTCGVPIVSTDCPSGPSEILENGYWGELTPVGDHHALADAILKTLKKENISKNLIKRANDFNVDHKAEEYLNIMFPN